MELEPQAKITCKQVKGVLIDSHVRVSLYVRGARMMTKEEYTVALNEAAKEFRAFVEDHRSKDCDDVWVYEERENQCSACHNKWETYKDETGTLICACCGAKVES